jgi:hypothetical protein
MQHLPAGVEDEEGCFVYQAIGGHAIAVRSALDTGDKSRTEVSFPEGFLVSIDLVRPSRVAGSKNGPFLRLSDCSGWLFVRKQGKAVMKRIPVEKGTWVFRVDNCGAGQALRAHPMGESPHLDGVSYQPMQRIRCDRKVTHPQTGVCSYRVQGTEGWVFDRRPGTEGKDDGMMLIDDTMVREGLFAFRAIAAVVIRRQPDIGEKKKTGRRVHQEEIIAVDMIRESPFNYGNGPFLRLADGSGWLFEKKIHEQVMVQIPVQTGSWVLRAAQTIELRRLPIDSVDTKEGTVYEFGDSVDCDCKIVCPVTGVSFYRVQGKDGWVFDRRAGRDVWMVVAKDLSPPGSTTDASAGSGWSPDFVRGLAASIEGVEEISFNPTSRLISFQKASDEEARINVYYTTRTVGTALDHPRQSKTQLFRRECSPSEVIEIMKNPRVHTGRGYKSKASMRLEGRRGVEVDKEEEARCKLLECDKEMTDSMEKRRSLLRTIRLFDLKRAREAENFQKKETLRGEELERVRQKLVEVEEKARQDETERQRILRECICSECGRNFHNAHARNQHYRDVHEYYCEICGRVFFSLHSLNQHCDATNHW